MIESLINFRQMHKRPYLAFFWACIIVSIAVLISSQLSYQMVVSNITINLTGIFAVLFSMIPSIYFITLLIKREERLEEKMIVSNSKESLWDRHKVDILIFLFFFAGATITYAVWSFSMPEDFFQVQVAKINQIHGIGGAARGQLTGFSAILFNNIQVMFFAFLFSFLFGAGVIFILLWNASVLGVYIGQLSKNLWHIPIVSLSFLPHGLPEIAGYVCAGLSGGLISAAILRRGNPEVLKTVMFDCVKIFILGVFLVFIGAVIEVYL